MSSLSQFGGGSVPVGGLAPFWGAPNNFIEGAEEYLRTGVLKAMSGYSDLVTKRPGAAYVLATQKLPSGGGNTVAIKHDGVGRYFIFGSGAAPRTTTSLSVAWAATTVDTDTACVDAFSFNGRVIHLAGTNIHTFNSSSAATTTDAGTAQNSGAGNAAGNLCMTVARTNGASGHAYTSTDGTTFTARAPTSTRSSVSVSSVWQPVSSTFATLCADGSVQTTANGYTFTDRGLVANLTTVETIGSTATGAALMSAASATVTLFSAKATYSGTTNTPVLVSSTDGATFTATPWSTLLGFAISVYPTLTVAAGVFYVTVPGSLTNDGLVGSVFSSTNGTTWARVATPVLASLPSGYSLHSTLYLNGEFVIANTSVQVQPLGTIPDFTHTHVGCARPAYGSPPVADYSNVPLYMRIK